MSQVVDIGRRIGLRHGRGQLWFELAVRAVVPQMFHEQCAVIGVAALGSERVDRRVGAEMPSVNCGMTALEFSAGAFVARDVTPAASSDATAATARVGRRPPR